MRVVHVAPTAFGAGGLFGGGERYPLALARAVADHVDCELVTFGNRAAVGRDGPLTIRVLHTLTRLGGHPAHPVGAGLVSALQGADIVHAHHLRAAPSRVAAIAAQARRQPFVVTDHGLGGGGWFGLLPRLADRFLTVSAHSAASLGVAPARTRVVYGGVDTTLFRPDAEERSGVLFVGRLTPHKGVDRLIRALPSGATLTVAGTTGHDRRTPERDYPLLLRHLAAGRDVRFVDRPDDDGVAALYRRASVFALPSVDVDCYGRRIPISELLGLSVLEAMASGTPVVASRIGGIPEVVADGETGFLVDAGDEASLRERIGELLRNPALARRMGDAGRAVAADRFTWDVCARRCLDAYAELTGAE